MLNTKEYMVLYRVIDKHARKILKLYESMQRGRPFSAVALPIAIQCLLLDTCIRTLSVNVMEIDLYNGVSVCDCEQDYFLYRNLNEISMFAYRSYVILQMYSKSFTRRTRNDVTALAMGLTELIRTVASTVSYCVSVCTDVQRRRLIGCSDSEWGATKIDRSLAEEMCRLAAVSDSSNLELL